MPRVSVVITSYNSGLLIGETLDSILTQSYRDFEIIVVDGGSTDNTIEVVSRYPSPVRLIAGQRLTKSAGRNVGIRAAQGEYIGFVDADDLWLPDKLQAQMDVFKEQPNLKWVYSDCYMFDGQTKANICTWSSRSRLHAGAILGFLFQDYFIASPTPLVRREVFDAVGYFDETLLRHQPEDTDMWLRVAAKFPIGLVPKPLARFRRHPNSLTMREDPKMALEGVLFVLDRAVVREPARLGPLRGQVFAKHAIAFGRGYAGRGQTSAARALFMQAVHYYPVTPAAYLYWMGTWLGNTLLHYLYRLYVAKRGY